MASQPRRSGHRTAPVTAATTAVSVAALLTLAGCGASSGTSSAASSASATPSPSAGSSSGSTPAAPGAASGKPAQAPPAGYQWAGSASQKIWLAVPDSWTVLNLNSMSVAQALSRIHVKGESVSEQRQSLEDLKKDHAIAMTDLASARTSPIKFATNVNAHCLGNVGAPAPGAPAAEAIVSDSKTEYAKLGVQVVAAKKITVSSTRVLVRFTIKVPMSNGTTIDELQYVDLTSQRRVCYVTFSTDRPSEFFPVFAKIAATIQDH